MQRLDDLERQLTAAIATRIAAERHASLLIDARLRHFHPQRGIDHARHALQRLGQSLVRGVRSRIDSSRAQTASLSRALNAVSPLATLGRGFAIVTTPAPASAQRWGTPITSIEAARSGQKVVAHLRDGVLRCSVDEIESNAS